MPDTGAPWNLRYPDVTDLVVDGPEQFEDLADDVAAGLDKLVLQVVEASTTTPVTITSGSFTDTGLSASITPRFSTSKVLVICSMAAELDAGTASDFDCEAAITRADTAIRAFRVAMAFDGTLTSTFTNSVLDSPSTTSAVTYKGRARLVSTGSSRQWSAQDVNAASTIVLMEILG